MTKTTSSKKMFRVWINKDWGEKGSEAYKNAAKKAIDYLKSKYDFSDGNLSHRPAYVFTFPDSKTAYDWFYREMFELDSKFVSPNDCCMDCSFEDNFNNWKLATDDFIENPKNKGLAYYRLWCDEK